MTEWNSLDINIHISLYTTFKKHVIHEFRPVSNSVFNVHNPIDIKLLTKLRPGLSHLNEHI